MKKHLSNKEIDELIISRVENIKTLLAKPQMLANCQKIRQKTDDNVHSPLLQEDEICSVNIFPTAYDARVDLIIESKDISNVRIEIFTALYPDVVLKTIKKCTKQNSTYGQHIKNLIISGKIENLLKDFIKGSIYKK